MPVTFDRSILHSKVYRQNRIVLTRCVIILFRAEKSILAICGYYGALTCTQKKFLSGDFLKVYREHMRIDISFSESVKDQEV